MNKRVRTGIVTTVAAAVVGVGGFAVGAAATDTSEPVQDETTTSLKDDEARGERPDDQGPEGSQDESKGSEDDAKKPEGEGRGGPEGGHGPKGPKGGEGPGEPHDGKAPEGQKRSGDDC